MKNIILLLSFFLLNNFVFSQQHSSSQIEGAFKIVEEMPRYAGCEEENDKAKRKKCSFEKVMKYVEENMIYPEKAKKTSAEGTVIVQFIVEKDGSLSNIKNVRTIGIPCGTNCNCDCEEQLLDVFRSMPNWIPGKQNGKPVRVIYNFPIQLKLE